MSEQILIISTDPLLIQQVQVSLNGRGYELKSAPTGLEALRRMYVARPDLIILDGRSPNFEILHRIRQVTDLPILMFVSEGEIPRGLNEGADDCLSEPFLPEELAARVRALLRRARLPPTTEWVTHYIDDQVSINLEQKRVLVQGERVHLTPVEFRLLACLVGNAGNVVSRQQLMARVWGPEHVGKDYLLSPRIYKLRQKIEPDPRQPEYIVTERGFGYRFQGKL